jgi:hypothetical protein
MRAFERMSAHGMQRITGTTTWALVGTRRTKDTCVVTYNSIVEH